LRTRSSTSRAGLYIVASVAVAILLACVGSYAQDAREDGRTPPTEWRRKIKERSTPPAGWRSARMPELTDEQREDLERLQSLGYLAGGASAPPRSGVTVHEQTKTWAGLNLYVSGDLAGARLMDMDGNIVHEWHCEFLDAWPDREKEAVTENGARYWFHAHLFPNGDIIGVHNSLGLVKLDKDSNVIWTYDGGSHHHVHVADNGYIYTITHEPVIDDRISRATDMLEDAIVILDANGRELRRVSIMEAFWNSDYASWLHTGVINHGRRKIDVFHTNRIVALDDRLKDSIPSFHEGNLLLSHRNLNALSVLDMETEKIVWTMAGPWLQQHCPSLLDNGNVLLFDNQGNYGSSRILEFDPVTQEVAWMYAGDAGNDFYSEKSGTAQKLSNGNYLIAESHFGRAFEVTPAGDIVWEYYSPARAGEDNELVANLFEIQRLPKAFPTDWLE
jgi:hypothetical protein